MNFRVERGNPPVCLITAPGNTAMRPVQPRTTGRRPDMPDSQLDPGADRVYDPSAIFNDDRPIDPMFMAGAIQSMVRAMAFVATESTPRSKNLRKAIKAIPKIRPLRTGDFVP